MLASSIAAVGSISRGMRPQVLPMPDEHPWLDNATDRTKGDPWGTIPGYGGSKALMEGMTKFVCRQNPQLDVINLRIAIIIPKENANKPVKPPDSGTGLEARLVWLAQMHEADMMQCLDLAIRAKHKPGVRVLNAVAQHAIVAPGTSVPDVLREWYGEEAANAIPGLSRYDEGGDLDGDHSIFDTQRCYDEIGFRSKRKVKVEEPHC